MYSRGSLLGASPNRDDVGAELPLPGTTPSAADPTAFDTSCPPEEPSLEHRGFRAPVSTTGGPRYETSPPRRAGIVKDHTPWTLRMERAIQLKPDVGRSGRAPIFAQNPAAASGRQRVVTHSRSRAPAPSPLTLATTAASLGHSPPHASLTAGSGTQA